MTIFRVKYCGFDDNGNFVIVNPLNDYELNIIPPSPSERVKYQYVPRYEVLGFEVEDGKLKINYDDCAIAINIHPDDGVVIDFGGNCEVIPPEEFWDNFVEENREYDEDKV